MSKTTSRLTFAAEGGALDADRGRQLLILLRVHGGHPGSLPAARAREGYTGCERPCDEVVTAPARTVCGWNAGARGSRLAPRARHAELPRTRHVGDRVGDRLLYGLTARAALLGVLVVFAIIWRVADGAWPAIKAFHLVVPLAQRVECAAERVRRARPDHRHGRHVVRRHAARGAALDRDRPLPQRARAAGDPRADRDARSTCSPPSRASSSASGGSTCSRRSTRSTCSRSSARSSAGSRSSRTARTRSNRPCSRRSSS